MKVFISCDIEGCCGIAAWPESEAGKGGRWYDYFSRQMTREVAAACEGAQAAGAKDILVKDAHDTGRNIDPLLLPRGVRLNRGWSGDPFGMVAGLSAKYDALAFVGYHAGAWDARNPLSHTMYDQVERVLINGRRASEFLIHSYVAGMLGVPVVFLSGDAGVCSEAKELLPKITTVVTGEGEGDSSTSIHPSEAVEQIREQMESALTEELEELQMPMPTAFEVQVRYTTHAMAYAKSFYPTAKQVDEKTIVFAHADYKEVLRFFHFVL